jgi:hypothetical protein
MNIRRKARFAMVRTEGVSHARQSLRSSPEIADVVDVTTQTTPLGHRSSAPFGASVDNSWGRCSDVLACSGRTVLSQKLHLGEVIAPDAT